MGRPNYSCKEKRWFNETLCRLSSPECSLADRCSPDAKRLDRPTRGARYIFTLDLSRGYWQVPVKEADRHKIAFTTPHGLFQFRVMPFGLQGAPASFQQMMDSLLRGLETHSAAYLDDVVIHSRTWGEHLQHIQTVLARLREANLTIKPKKCQFGMRSCTYLGHVVGNGQVKPELAKLVAVRAFPAFHQETGISWL